ncbi:N-terminal acetyltransferase B complex catalytic subunit naa20 [Yarrowia sp. B02]|nr:N-terminal acetyltransferase B complex catalytic subunit naa20 [Yarrowia sp. B02]
MSSITPFHATDLFKTNPVNLDVLTENYTISFYLQYLAEWPSLFFQTLDKSGLCAGYMMGKAEGKGMEWHSHITAVTVAYTQRRAGLAKFLCTELERRTAAPEPYHCYFVDLFVRTTNQMAIDMYEGFDYSVYRRVVGYYGDREDAYDMRKALERDVNRETVRDDGRDHKVKPWEVVF